jgi:hypothetical protein
MYSDPIWKVVMTRRSGIVLIGLAFLIGFAISAAFILNTRHEASVIHTDIPYEVRARHLFLSLLGPFSWSWHVHVQGSAWFQCIWTAAIFAGLLFARNALVVALAMLAAFTWPLFAILRWGLMVS